MLSNEQRAQSIIQPSGNGKQSDQRCLKRGSQSVLFRTTRLGFFFPPSVLIAPNALFCFELMLGFSFLFLRPDTTARNNGDLAPKYDTIQEYQRLMMGEGLPI